MKRFFLNILLFALPFPGILLVADYLLSREAAHSNYRPIESWYDLMHGNIDADIIVMGNSRAWVHFDPMIMDSILCVNTYNIGIDGSAVNRQVHKYNLFKKRNRKPKVILQNIDLNSLNYTVGYEREQFLPYFLDRSMRNEFLPSEPFTFCEKYIPLHRYHMIEIKNLFSRGPRSLTKGYQGMDWIWDDSKYKGISKLTFAPSDTTVRMFEEYLAETKADSIKVVFVYSPYYIGATGKITNLEEMQSFYQDIANKYDIPVLDYSQMSICSDTTFFYNAMHLNRRGAELFTDSLANDIKKLGVLK